MTPLRRMLLAGSMLLIAVLGNPGLAESQNCTPPPGGIVSWWSGDGNAEDIINDNHGTLQGGATYGPGQVGQAFRFDGANDRVLVGDHASLNFSSNDFSVEAWVKADSFNVGWFSTIVSKRSEFPPWTGWWLGWEPSGLWRVEVGSATFANMYSNLPATIGTWLHLAFTVDRTAQILSIYVNGVRQTANGFNQPSTAGFGSVSSSTPLTIGETSRATYQQFDGLIDEVSVYNRTLSTAEIAAIHAAGTAGKCKGSLEIVDPNPALLKGGDVSSDPQALATGGRPVHSAAADGVTRVLLRATVDTFGSVDFRLDGASYPQDGGLAAVGSSSFSDRVLAPVESTSEGLQAFAVYKTPAEFNRGTDNQETSRRVAFIATFMPFSGTPVQNGAQINLVRPPVVLLHGLWSDGTTWQFRLVSDARFRVSYLFPDYRTTNAASFALNRLAPRNLIDWALLIDHRNGIAATQVDFGGHSMGGILGRNHVSMRRYKNNWNYNEGDIHKLITLNTPHTGSLLASIAAEAQRLGGSNFRIAMGVLGHPVPASPNALDDLSRDSLAIDTISATPVPSHALVGVGGSDLVDQVGGFLSLLPPPYGPLFLTLDLFTNFVLFDGEQHDLVVDRQSQEGGIAAQAQTPFDGFDSIHFRVTKKPVFPWRPSYFERLDVLLNGDAQGPSFSRFPAPRSLPFQQSAPSVGTRTSTVPDSHPDGLTITSPAQGTVVSSGSVVTVAVEPELGLGIESLLLVGPHTAQTDDSAPFEIDLPLPEDEAGQIQLYAVGIDSAGNYYGSNLLGLVAVPAANLESIVLQPRDPLLLGIGDRRQLFALGSYDDAVLRYISEPVLGTEYMSSDSAIVAVDSQGMITSQALGSAIVTVRNGLVQDSVTVTVSEPANRPPTADAGADQQPECSSSGRASVLLDGSGSYDPDSTPGTNDDVVHWEWFENLGLPTELLLGTGPLFTVDLGLGSHAITLRIADREGLIDEDDLVALVQDSTPPSISAVVAEPSALWPPNHKMKKVIVQTAVIDLCDPSPACHVASVASNEAANGLGDGDREPDWLILGPSLVHLRSERAGNGAGRTYLLEIVCQDEAGNEDAGNTFVEVPHARSRG